MDDFSVAVFESTDHPSPTQFTIHSSTEDSWYEYSAKKLAEVSPTIPTLPTEPDATAAATQAAEPAGTPNALQLEAPNSKEVPVRVPQPLPAADSLPEPTNPQDGFVAIVIEPPTEEVAEAAEKPAAAAATAAEVEKPAAAPATAAADGQGATVALEEIVVVRTYPTKEEQKEKETLVPSMEAKNSKAAGGILPTPPSPLLPATPVYTAVNTAELAGYWTMPTGAIHPVYQADLRAHEHRMAQGRAEQKRAEQQRLYEEEQRQLAYQRELAAWHHQEALRRAYEWQTAMWRRQREEQQRYPQHAAHHYPRPHGVATTCHQQDGQNMPVCGYGQGYGSLACGAW